MFTIACVLTEISGWLRTRITAMQFFRLVSSAASRHVSIVVRRTHSLQAQGDRINNVSLTSGRFLHSKLVYLAEASKAPVYCSTLLEENGCQLLNVDPQLCLSISLEDGWCRYHNHNGTKAAWKNVGTSNIDVQVFLVELRKLECEEEIKVLTDRATLRECATIALEDLADLLAWRSNSSNDVDVIARCSTHNLALLCHSFFDGHLIARSNAQLQVESINSVYIDDLSNYSDSPAIIPSPNPSPPPISKANHSMTLIPSPPQKHNPPPSPASLPSQQYPPSTVSSVRLIHSGQDLFNNIKSCANDINCQSDIIPTGSAEDGHCNVKNNLEPDAGGKLPSDISQCQTLSSLIVMDSINERGMEYHVDQQSAVLSDNKVFSHTLRSNSDYKNNDKLSVDHSGGREDQTGFSVETLSGGGEGQKGLSVETLSSGTLPVDTLSSGGEGQNGLDTRLQRKTMLAGKPPNVVVYCGKVDSRRLYEKVRDVIAQCLNPNRYAIYHLKHEQVCTTPWADNAILLIIASEKTYDGADTAFADYFLRHGGTLLSFTCLLDKQFVRLQNHDAKPCVVQIRCEAWDAVTVIAGKHFYEDTALAESCIVDGVTLTSLATELQTGQPVIVEAKCSKSGGLAIFSQVNLEKDPSDMAISTEVFAALKRSNAQRFEILTYLIIRCGLDCNRPIAPALTPLHLLTTNRTVKSSFLSSVLPRLKNGSLVSKDVTLFFGDPVVCAGTTVTSTLIPVMTDTLPSIATEFDHAEYCRVLRTLTLGNTMLFTAVITTTMTLFDGLMFSVPTDVGLVAVARRQTQGQGRGGNVWLSPDGCAMFSLHVRVPLVSNLGERVSYLQHIAALAVVLAVRRREGYESIDLRIKWPNDIYFGSAVKLGGVIVRSSMMTDVIHAIIGCGANVTNSNPTICINDLIGQYNQATGCSLQLFSVEELIGRTITWIDQLINDFQKDGLGGFLELYHQYWLHSNAEVQLNSSTGPKGKITGLDNYGYLEVLLSDGRTVTVQPDGNSFDMMKNLIAPKNT